MKQHIPNALSITRAGISLILLLFLFIPHPFFVAQLLFIAGLITDKLDGTLARLWKTESELGKKLESVVDPLFSFAGGCYIILKLDFPLQAFWIALTWLIVISLFRAAVTLKKGHFFYEKSPLTRYGVGFLYLVALCYFLQVPYREWLVWPLMGYGSFAGFNYIRMMIRFVNPHHRHDSANGGGQAQ